MTRSILTAADPYSSSIRIQWIIFSVNGESCRFNIFVPFWLVSTVTFKLLFICVTFVVAINMERTRCIMITSLNFHPNLSSLSIVVTEIFFLSVLESQQRQNTTLTTITLIHDRPSVLSHACRFFLFWHSFYSMIYIRPFFAPILLIANIIVTFQTKSTTTSIWTGDTTITIQNN